MKYQLVLQFEWKNGDMESFDQLVALESELAASGHDVDGHDAGSGEFNIFINTNDAEASFASIMQAVQEIDRLKAAYRDFASDDYIILWPPKCSNFDVK